MGLFGLFGKKGTPIDDKTVVKRMSENKGDFKGILCDDEDHPVDVYESSEVANTMMGRTRVVRLCCCRDTVESACVRLAKRQAEMFYISPRTFRLAFGWQGGGRVEMTVKMDRNADSLPNWLLANVTEPGKNVTAEELGKLLDRKFPSDAPPEWLTVIQREDFEDLEPPPQQPEESAFVELKPGAVVFGHYKIEKELGEGGMGMVFLATDTQTVVESHRQVVLKVLRCDNCNDETSLREFIKEANTLSELRDDRIAACYWCKRLGNMPVLAMEYVEGMSLDAYLAKQKGGRIDEATTQELLRPIAEALDYAHERGIYHRDVKPQNIIVRTQPKKIGSRLIKTSLLDFGIASREQTSGPTTSFLSVRGTFLYMSPEQLLIGRKPSASMDIYSLAVTAYECLTGRMPYPEGWQREATVPPLESKTPFANAVMRGFEMLPENRPATCRELIDPPKTMRPVVPVPAAPPPRAEEAAAPVKAPMAPPKQRTAANPNAVVSIAELQRSITIYRQMLTMSANKCEKDRPEEAKWLRDRQGALRDLTADPENVSEMALVRFFEDVAEHVRAERMRPDDVFLAHDRLVELRATIRAALAVKKNVAVGQALKLSID